ncbi:hypothetical protein GQ55_4G014900 [Panicum hallii var. hallii]|uniref:Uncharacterized protein n=1 Tax=Panicum hallii var. hallii TaxID=1504633 RepID=A0A2T7DU68_9POAL|nr:hypothetical protein GQ55_4G014900 [Panicum hallii var. hallii]
MDTTTTGCAEAANLIARESSRTRSSPSPPPAAAACRARCSAACPTPSAAPSSPPSPRTTAGYKSRTSATHLHSTGPPSSMALLRLHCFLLLGPAAAASYSSSIAASESVAAGRRRSQRLVSEPRGGPSSPPSLRPGESEIPSASRPMQILWRCELESGCAPKQAA